MLASLELGVLDFAGHVSVRSPTNPNRYLISRWSAPADATPEGIIENDLDSVAVGGARKDEYREAYMHGEIYRARPDVMAVVHAHTPEVTAFTQSSVELRPVSNGGRFIGSGLPIFDIRQFHPAGQHHRQPGTRQGDRGGPRQQSRGAAQRPRGHGHGLVFVRARQPRLQPACQRDHSTAGDQPRGSDLLSARASHNDPVPARGSNRKRWWTGSRPGLGILAARSNSKLNHCGMHS